MTSGKPFPTSPSPPWDPSILDSQVDDTWYKETPDPSLYSQEMPFDDGGRLRDQPDEEVEDIDEDDRNHQAVDRAGIKTFFADLIRDELQSEFTVCNIDGFLVDVRGADPYGSDSEDDEPTPPLSAQNARWSHPDTDSDSDSDSDGEVPPLLEQEYYDSSSGSESEDDRPRRSSTRRCFPVTRSQSRPAAPKKQERTKKGKTRRKKPKKSEAQGHDPELQDESDPDEDKEDSTTPHLESNNRAKTGQAISESLLEPNEETGEPVREAEPRIMHPSKKDVAEYSKYFPGTDADTLRKTFDATTQYGTRGATDGHTLHNQISSPNPVLNIPRRHETVATDTLYSDTPAFDSGSTAAQFFIGRKSHFRSA